MKTKPRLLIVAGANGTGKSTFAYQYRDEFGIDYLGADEIAEKFKRTDDKSNEIKAGREFFKRLQAFLDNKKSVIIESTISGTGLLKKIKDFKNAGFSIFIVYVFLESPELCKKRIKIRVKKGGHTISEKDIERRFSRSLKNFWERYKSIADEWQILYNGKDRPIEVAFNEDEDIVVTEETFFKIFRNISK